MFRSSVLMLSNVSLRPLLTELLSSQLQEERNRGEGRVEVGKLIFLAYVVNQGRFRMETPQLRVISCICVTWASPLPRLFRRLAAGPERISLYQRHFLGLFRCHRKFRRMSLILAGYPLIALSLCWRSKLWWISEDYG